MTRIPSLALALIGAVLLAPSMGAPASAQDMVLYDFMIPDPARPIHAEPGQNAPTGELMNFEQQLPGPEKVVGRTVDQIDTHVGTYGTGGPGFFGLRLGEEWLVISIWGASEWITVDGRLVEDFFGEKHDRPLPWIGDHGDELTEKLVGQEITSFKVAKQSLSIGLANGMSIEIAEDPDARPLFEGSKEKRAFAENDDLRKGVFLSPTAEIWISG
jgi:hypothetical protein